MSRLILASKSQARVALLAGAGLAVEAIAADIDERALDADLTARGAGADKVALALAAAKAVAVSVLHPGATVIGADQTLALGDRRYSKPKDLAGARDHLMSFRGRIHHLHAGVAVAEAGRITFSTVTTAEMHVRAFSPSFLDGYLARVGDRILGSVGAYQFEGEGIQLFDRIDGDYHTILGLPLIPLLGHLRASGRLPS